MKMTKIYKNLQIQCILNHFPHLILHRNRTEYYGKWNHKRTHLSKTILSKKNNAGGIPFPDLKIYDRAIAIKAIWYLWNTYM